MPGNLSTGLVSIGEVCRLTSTHINTVRKYSDSGELPCYRIGRGKRRYELSDVRKFFGLKVEETNASEARTILIARVSDGRRSVAFTKDNGVQSDLSRQVARLKQYAREVYNDDNPLVFAGTASGMNCERKELKSLISKLLNGEIRNATILATRPERILRVGRPLFDQIVKWANCRIQYIEQDEAFENEEAESIPQLITEFVTSMVGKLYSRRSALRNTRKISPQVVTRLLQLKAEGHSINKIVQISNSLGLKADCGAPITYKVMQRVLDAETPRLELNGKSSIDRFISEEMRMGAGGLRIKKQDFFEQFKLWAEKNDAPLVSAHVVGRKLSGLGIKSATIPDKKTSNKKCWCGIYLKSNEGLSILVREAPKPLPQASSEDSILLFYNSVAVGREWVATSLLKSYQQFAKSRGIRPETRQKLVRKLGDLGHVSRPTTRGWIYDLTEAKKLSDSSGKLGGSRLPLSEAEKTSEASPISK
jgi:predicted site-specific integrase-resolvase